jgi:hypothetical protein
MTKLIQKIKISCPAILLHHTTAGWGSQENPSGSYEPLWKKCFITKGSEIPGNQWFKSTPRYSFNIFRKCTLQRSHSKTSAYIPSKIAEIMKANSDTYYSEYYRGTRWIKVYNALLGLKVEADKSQSPTDPSSGKIKNHY